jgi:hypothetical protein
MSNDRGLFERGEGRFGARGFDDDVIMKLN